VLAVDQQTVPSVLSSAPHDTLRPVPYVLLKCLIRVIPARRPLVWLLASAIVAVIAPSSAATAAVLGGFSARPFDPSGNPGLRSYFRWQVRGGGRYSGKLLVTNSEDVAVHLRVYPVDAVTGTTSGAVYPNGGTTLRRDGRWLSTAVSELTVPAHRHRAVVFGVSVPRGAVPGDHLAAVALENRARPRVSRGAIAIVQVMRAAVAVEMRVAGPVSSGLRMNGLWLRPLPGTQTASVVVDLRNTGTLICRPRLSVTLAGPGGALGRMTRGLDAILPGDEIPYPLAWPRSLSAGGYSVAATAAGCGPRRSLQRSIDLDSALRGTTSPTAVAARGAVPWWLLVLIGGGAGAGGVLLGWLVPRRLRQRRLPPAIV
jgi:hypothetical protein